MTRSAVAIHVLMFSSLVGAGCGSETPRRVLPTAPTTVVPPPAVVIGTPAVVIGNGESLNGRVTDTAFRPIAGATVEVVDGAHAGMTTTANASGQFAFTGAFELGTRFRGTKDGYLEGVSQLTTRCETCQPQLWVNLSLGLPIPPANIAGEYTMTVEACNALPLEARTRTFTASIVPAADQPTSANTFFRADIGGAPVVRGASWEGLWLAVAGDYMEVWMGDYHGQPGLIERLGEDTYYSVDAWGTTTVGADGTIVLPFTGEAAYCVIKPGVEVLDTNRRYTCDGARSVTRMACGFGRLTLTKR